MLRLVGLFARLLHPPPPSEETKDKEDRSVGEGLSDFERRAIGDSMFSRDGLQIAEGDVPRFASMVMPPHL